MQVKVGDTVTWESQALGYYKVKRGTVIAIVPAGVHIAEIWPEAMKLPKARKKWSDDVSRFDRAVVEVMRESGRGCDYYAPRLSMLQRG